MKTPILFHWYLWTVLICLNPGSLSQKLTEHEQETYHAINRRSALLIQAIAETTATLAGAYADNELQSAADIALELIGRVPILGDIVYILAKNPDSAPDIKSGLTTINDNLKVLNTNLKNIEIKVDELSTKIDLSVMKHQVATDKREISNCYEDFLLFVQNTSSKAEQDRLKQCYFKFAYIRQIGRILNNEKLTFMENPIFDKIIDITGYCDGQRLQEVYGFLFGIYIEGCTALVTSEVLIYGNESITYMNECKTTIRAASNTHTKIFRNCKMELCNKYIKVMINMLKTEQPPNIKSQIQTSFPWFNFVIVTLPQSGSSGIALNNIRDLNVVTLSSNGVVYRVLIWSRSTNRGVSGVYMYSIEYKENEVEYFFNDMNLIKATKNGLTKMFGVQDNSSLLTSGCNQDFNIDDQTESEVDTDMKDIVFNDESNSRAGRAVALIIIGLIIIIVGVVILIQMWRTGESFEVVCKSFFCFCFSKE